MKLFKRKKITLKQLREQTSTLERRAKAERSLVEKERESARLKSELFKLKHRKGIRVAKGVWKGFKAGGRGLVAIQRGIQQGTISPRPIKKKKKKKSQKKRRKKVIIKYY